MLALSFRPVKTTAAHIVVDLADSVCKEIFGEDFSNVFGMSVQDAAATKIAKDMGFEVETCDMHDSDKVGASVVGELTRRKFGIEVNQFPEGLALLGKLRDQAKHFASSHTNRQRYEQVLNLHSNLPKTNLKRDLCKTRISSVFYLVRSSLRLKRALTIYCETFGINTWLTEDDWRFCTEMEAILRASTTMSTLSQNEKKLISAFAPVMRKNLHDALTKKTMDIIDVKNWGNQVRFNFELVFDLFSQLIKYFM